MNVTTETEKLINDLRAVVVDTEELIKATAGQANERIEKVRARAAESLNRARDAMRKAEGDVREEVRENPWTAVGVAAFAGLLIGVLLGRK